MKMLKYLMPVLLVFVIISYGFDNITEPCLQNDIKSTVNDSIPFWINEGYDSYGDWLDNIPNDSLLILFLTSSGEVKTLDLYGQIGTTNLTEDQARYLTISRSQSNDPSQIQSPYNENLFIQRVIPSGDSEKWLKDGNGQYIEQIWDIILNDSNQTSVLFNQNNTFSIDGYLVDSGGGGIIPLEWLSENELLFNVYSMKKENEIVENEVHYVNEIADNITYNLETQMFKRLSVSTNVQMTLPSISPNGNYLVYLISNDSIRDLYHPNSNMSIGMYNVLNDNQAFYGNNILRVIGWTSKRTFTSNYNPTFQLFSSNSCANLPNSLGTVCGESINTTFYLPWECGKAYYCSRDGDCRPNDCSLAAGTNIYVDSYSYSNVGGLQYHSSKRAFDFSDKKIQGHTYNNSNNPSSKILASLGGKVHLKGVYPTYINSLGNPAGGESYIIIDHLNGLYSRYLHLTVSSNLSVGTPVSTGSLLGYEHDIANYTVGEHIHVDYSIAPSTFPTNSFYPRFHELSSNSTPHVKGVYVSQNPGPTGTSGLCNRIDCSQVTQWNLNTSTTLFNQSTVGGATNISTYWSKPYSSSYTIGTAAPSWDCKGPEKVYEINVPPGSFNVKITTLNGNANELAVFALKKQGICSTTDPMSDCVGESCGEFASWVTGTTSSNNCYPSLTNNEHIVSVSNVENPNGGNYYIVVDGRNVNGQSFNIEISCLSGCVSLGCDPNEPNNDVASSQTPILQNIGTGTSISNQIINSCLDFDNNDIDYYAFIPTSKGKLTIDITGQLPNLILSNLLYDLEIIDDTGTVIASDGIFSAHHIELCVGEGTGFSLGKIYYLRLEASNILNGTRDYTINYSWTNSTSSCHSNFQWTNIAHASGVINICDGDPVILDINNPTGFINVTDGQGNLLSTTVPFTVYPTQFQTYYIHDYQANGNVTTEYSDVIVNSISSPIITQSPSGSINTGTPVTLSAYAQGASTYHWSNGSQSSSISVSPLQTTTYTITVTNANGCTATQSHTVIVNGTTTQAPPNNIATTATFIPIGSQCSSSSAIQGTLIGATMSNNSAIVAPTGCSPTSTTGNNNGNFHLGTGGDVWFYFNAPNSGEATIETYGSSLINDLVISIYHKVGNNYTLIGCYDDYISGIDFMPRVTLIGLIAGEEYYIRAWDFSNNNAGSFGICAYDSGSQGGGGNVGSDVQVSSVSATASNGNIIVTYTVTNNGNQNTSVGYPTIFNLVSAIRFGSGIAQSSTFGTQQLVPIIQHLSAGSSTTYTETVPIPSGTSNGQYSIVVVYDPLNITSDLDLTDNYGSATIYLGGSGGSGLQYDWDLTNGLDVTLNNSYPYYAPGAVIEVELELENIGTVKTPEVDVEIIFSDDDNPGPGDITYTLGWMHFGEISANGDETNTEDYTIPFINSTGNWHVVAKVHLPDADNSNNDDDENIYISTINPVAPDIQITYLGLYDYNCTPPCPLHPDSVYMDTKVAIEFELKNIGNAPSTSFNTSTTIRRDLNNYIRFTNGVFIDDFTRSLNVNESEILVETFIPRDKAMGLGSWYIHTEANCDYNGGNYCTRDIGEQGFGNNTIYKQITVRDTVGLPNLYGGITSVSPGTLELGDSATITCYIVNDSNATIYSSEQQVRFYTSVDANYDGGEISVGEHLILSITQNDTIQPGDTSWITQKALIRGSAMQIGINHIVGRIDYDMEYSEISHDDNTLLGFPFYLSSDDCWFILNDNVNSSSTGYPDTLDWIGKGQVLEVISDSDCQWDITGEFKKVVPLYDGDTIIGDTILPASNSILELFNNQIGNRTAYFKFNANEEPYWKEIKIKFGQQNNGGKYDSLYVWQKPQPHPDYVGEFVGLELLNGISINPDSIPRQDSIKATFLIKNNGDDATENYAISSRLYRSNSDPLINYDWIQIGNQVSIPKLDSALVDTIDFYFVLDEVDTSYLGQLKLVIDVYDKQPEIRENNNETYVDISSYNDGKSTGNITLFSLDSLGRYDVELRSNNVGTELMKARYNNSNSLNYHTLYLGVTDSDSLNISPFKVDFRIAKDSILSYTNSQVIGTSLISNLTVLDSLQYMNFRATYYSTDYRGWNYGFVVLNSDRRILEDNYDDNIRLVKFKSRALPIDSSGMVGIGDYYNHSPYRNSLISNIQTYNGPLFINVPVYKHTDTLQFSNSPYAVILKPTVHSSYNFIDTIPAWKRYYPNDKIIIPVTELPGQGSSYPYYPNNIYYYNNIDFLPKIDVYTNKGNPNFQYILNFIKPDADYEIYQLPRTISNSYYNANTTRFNTNSTLSVDIVYRNKALFTNSTATIPLETLALQFLMSNDNTISNDDYILLDTIISTPNSTNMFDTINYSLFIDSIPTDFDITNSQGQIYLIAKIDSKNWVWENNENDNSKTTYFNILAPNYRFVNMHLNNSTVPVTMTFYDPIHVSYSLKNDYPFSPNTQVSIKTELSYVKQNVINGQLIDGSIFPILSFDTIPTNVGTNYITHNLIPNGLTNGIWKIRVNTDYDNDVRERIETDNIEERIMFVFRDSTGMPNAVIDSLTLLSNNNLAIGDTFKIAVNYKNTEDTIINGMKGILVFGDDYQNIITTDSILGNWILSGFDSLSGQRVDTLSYLIKHGNLGNHSISVILDPHLEIAELEKFDNIETLTINITDTSCHYYINNEFELKYDTAYSCISSYIGTQLHSLQTLEGCDSLVEITTLQLPIDSTSLSEVVCNPIDTGLFLTVLTNEYGCDSTLYITKSHLPITFQTTSDDVECKGDSTGNITITASGGTIPLNYAWDNGVNTNHNNNLVAGQYTLSITDDNNCLETTSILISEPSNYLTANINITSDYNGLPISCTDSTDGILTVIASGGTAPYLYLWNTGDTTQSINNLGEGTYYVTVTDVNYCAETDSVTIQSSVISIVKNTVDVNCSGNPEGKITLNLQGGIFPYTINWNNGAIGDSISNLYAGDYSFSLTDGNGCNLYDSATISEPLPLINSYTKQDVNCYGDSTGLINVQITGGVSPYTYNWNNGDTTLNLVNLPAAIFHLTSTDNNGCIKTDTIEINQPDSLVLNLNAVQVTCHNFNDGVIQSLVTGGLGMYQYNWFNGDVTDTINSLSGGQYQVVVTDSVGCTVTDSINVYEPTALTNTFEIIDIDCFGNANGSIISTPAGGNGGYNYVWSDNQLTSSIDNLDEGYYSLTITDSLGCVYLDTAYIQESPALITSPIINHACNGNDGDIDINALGGVLPYSYNWLNTTFGDTALIGNLVPDEYIVSITDSNGCQLNDTISILSSPVSNFTYNRTGDVLTFYSQSQYANSYSWNFGNGVYSQSSIDSVAYDSTGYYTVTLTISNDCGVDSSSQTILFILTNLQSYFNEGHKITLFPNPNSGVFNLSLSNVKHGNWEIAILDSKGALVYDKKVEIRNDEYLIDINLKDLSSATYYVRLMYEGQVVPILQLPLIIIGE